MLPEIALPAPVLKPLPVQEVAFVDDHVRIVDCPLIIVYLDAVSVAVGIRYTVAPEPGTLVELVQVKVLKLPPESVTVTEPVLRPVVLYVLVTLVPEPDRPSEPLQE